MAVCELRSGNSTLSIAGLRLAAQSLLKHALALPTFDSADANDLGDGP